MTDPKKPDVESSTGPVVSQAIPDIVSTPESADSQAHATVIPLSQVGPWTVVQKIAPVPPAAKK